MCALAMRRIRLCGFLFGYKRRLRKGQRPSKLTSKVTLTAFLPGKGLVSCLRSPEQGLRRGYTRLDWI